VVTNVQVGRGPLAAVSAGLAGAAEGGGSAGDPAAFLARLMDLRGSVELAQRLAVADRVRPGRGDAAARARLVDLTTERLSALEDEVARTFADPFHRRHKLPTPEQVVSVLIDSGALLDRRSRSIGAAAEALWAPAADLLGRALDRVRFELAALREEIGPPLCALGPAAARLERLDAALFGATARGRAELQDRLLAALGRSFAARFAAAVSALPGATAPAHVRPWFARGGIYRAEIDRGRDALLGVLAHDRRRFLALLAVDERGPAAASGPAPRSPVDDRGSGAASGPTPRNPGEEP
jgi:hypothetical protein